MSEEQMVECCPRFDPEPWDNQEFTWENRLFLKDRVRSFLHIPLNFGSVMVRSMARIEAAGVKPDDVIVLADENSLWGADVYISVSGDIPGAPVVPLSGRFMSRVFEGPYKNMRTWVGEMQAAVKSAGHSLDKLLFYYTTCPKCVRKYGKNYVVLLARVE